MRFLFIACSFLLFAATPAQADDKSDDKPADKPAAEPAPPPKNKRIIHSIELAASKKEPFSGSITLRLQADRKAAPLIYHWGGKCRRTNLPPSRIALLAEAMKHKYAVEIPSVPIKYDDRIYMCIRSIRIINNG